MQPTYQPLAQIFSTETRHLVPLFQRPYVWSREEQWEPLWDDVSDLGNRVLSGQKPVAGHFLGTVVLEQVDTPSGAVNRREIIDGQQRLTTLQILLQSARLALGSLATEDEGALRAAQIERTRLESLIFNPPGYDQSDRYKVWPTNDDRPAFKQVMDAVEPEALAGAGTRMSDAFAFFFGRVLEWLGTEDLGRRIPALSSALKDHLRLIVLDLDETDEPQAIFETLNAHGTPLLPADLIKNWLLWQFTRNGENAEPAYAEHWSGFDRDAQYWRQRIGTGHAARARIDTFLQSWLVRRERQPVSTKHLYDRFLKHAGGTAKSAAGALALMEDIAAHGRFFRQMDEPIGRSRFALFLTRLKALDMVVFQPVILAIMDRSGSDAADRDAVAEVLESYLVRRMVCGGQTRGYGTLAIEMLETIAAVAGDRPVAAALRQHLIGLAGTLAWPTDADFKLQWSDRNFYGYFKRSRVLMILQAIEEYLQTAATMGEPIVAFDFSKLTIEHLLPQEWHAHWPLEGDERARALRDQKLHGIGNLTLVSGSLNPSLSNAPWVPPADRPDALNKLSALQEHTRLQLNVRLLQRWAEQWNEATIEERALALFEQATVIWPR